MNETSNSHAYDEAPAPPWRPFRLLRFLGFVVASLLTLLALAWSVENWRGAQAWSTVKRDLVARGEPLSIEQLVPPLPPEAENFAATPLLRELFAYSRGGSGGGQSLWTDPHALAHLNAIALPQARTPRAVRSSDRSESTGSDGRMDLMSYALGIKLRPRTCPPNLDPALAERFGYLPPDVKWKKPTNELEMAASITDPAEEVLEYLRRFDTELKEIAEAVRRPRSQFPIHWAENYQALLPHLAPMKQFSLLFSVRAVARLHKQDTSGACADALTGLRLAQALETEPLLISQLVDMAQHDIALRPIWEGLVSHQWNDEQLAAFQTELARPNFQQQLTRAFRAERVSVNLFLDGLKRTGRSALDAVGSGQVEGDLGLGLIPWVPGWIRQNEVRLNQYIDLELHQLVDPRWPAKLVGALDQDAALRKSGLAEHGVYTFVAQMLAPDLTKAQAKAARAQVVKQLALVACALERHRLAQGAYPKDLSELTSRELPGSIQDPMTGAPLLYEQNASDGFKLWSVGLNGRNDGGIMLDKENDIRGDWVWPQPAMQKARLF